MKLPENEKKPEIPFMLPEGVTSGLFLEIPDFDRDFSQLETPPKIINEVQAFTKEAREELRNQLVKTYTSDTLEAIPSCQCGRLKGGEYLADPILGTEARVCGKCGTEVIAITERLIEPSYWVSLPPGIKAFIIPSLWGTLTNLFSSKAFCPLTWLIDPKYKFKTTAAHKRNVKEEALKQYNFTRGFNSFIDNFDDIIDVLLTDQNLKPKSVQVTNLMRLYVKENRHKFFPKHIPLPTSLAFIKEAVAVGTYIDQTVTMALDAIETVIGMYRPGNTLKPAAIERRTGTLIKQLDKYYNTVWKDNFQSKPGLLRKHGFGGRPDWSYRAVISSIHGVHDYREMHLPWALAVTVFSVHISSKLLDRGMSFMEVTELIRSHTYTYSHLLDEVMNEILFENVRKPDPVTEYCVQPIEPCQGFPTIFQRNPTLIKQAAQTLYITKIKRPETNDLTISLSTLVLAGPNADLIYLKNVSYEINGSKNERNKDNRSFMQ